ncbi:hypothetical protein [Ferdinandcohnia sp. SAFN-114]|uniref:hypothetical protein n=1 Tax=Ferdinandcohnia sp. SAFN-114 TaxID=3387275 RepID=UPI003F7CFDD5
MLIVLLSIFVSTIALIVLVDVYQGHSLYEAWYSLKNLLIVAKGEDYFLIIIFIITYLLLLFSYFRGKKKP